MILGFAHIAINVSDPIAAEKLWKKKGYTRQAFFDNVPNHISKKIFTLNYNKEHDILLLSGNGLWPIEITTHGINDFKNNQLFWNQNLISVKVPNANELVEFLVNGLGFHSQNNILTLNSRFSNWECKIKVESDNSESVMLDGIGPTCLAFYCNNLSVDVQHLINLGALDTTECFEISLGSKTMMIAMLRAPGGILIELINFKR
jgi:hypothetical protein